MKNYATMMMAVMIWAGTSAFAEAQDRGTNKDRQGFERIETLKKVRMMEVLKLDENLAIKFMTRYDKHEERMHDIENRRNNLIDKLQSLSAGDAADEEYNQTFDSLIQTNTEISDARTQFLEELKQILTSKQIAEYIVFERNFARDLRDIVRDVQRERMRDR